MTGNEQMVEHWNSDAAAPWASSPDRYDAMLEPFGERVLAAAALQPGERVLDVGCGAGQLTLQAAAAVGPSGAVVGVDVARGLLAVARQRAEQAGVTNVDVLEADAQVAQLPAVDVVLSRFGVMFFADPRTAFANLLAAVPPAGRLAFVCWQAVSLNDWITVPLLAAAEHVGFPEPPPPDAPGPMAFADADRLRGLLAEAGWDDLRLEDVQTTLRPGGARTADEAVAFMCADTFGKTLLDKADPEARARGVEAMRAAYAAREGVDGVQLKAAVWVVTARRPS
jgi:SAM-dependent methyltransferase